MIKECRFYCGDRADLAGQIVGVPNDEAVYAHGLIRHGLEVKRGGRGSPPSGVGQFTDICTLGAGPRPIALDVPTQ